MTPLYLRLFMFILVLTIFIVSYLAPDLNCNENRINFVDNISEFAGITTGMLIAVLSITFSGNIKDPIFLARNKRLGISVFILIIVGVLTFVTSSLAMINPVYTKSSIGLGSGLIVGLLVNLSFSFFNTKKSL